MLINDFHAGSDYNDPQPQNNGGPTENGNLRWRAGDTLPRVPYVVTILDDDIPEPVEMVEVMVQCVARENCYLPRTRYTITIIDDQGECHFKVVATTIATSFFVVAPHESHSYCLVVIM